MKYNYMDKSFLLAAKKILINGKHNVDITNIDELVSNVLTSLREKNLITDDNDGTKVALDIIEDVFPKFKANIDKYRMLI